ncbi:flagellar hook-associated protein 3 FlgL [Formivibrio citricus]|uniref:Flagellar hook-associated protein 3 FlgL n=1 Tax=Formivibrio citricus TaxID=83765 RepID=A0A1I4ZWH2_9NEIS|nr:flagellar hook-associated protein FlgL [Formivibrio citricus]SFN54566.1 flagellar hook-associated protein 3 FlgL [Formivibrio citricus]
MRIATSTLFNVSRSGLQKHSVDQARLQEQLSTGKRILTPSDDPIASARVLTINQSASINTQYSTNSDSADSALRTTESTLSQVISVIQDVQTLAVNAGNPSLTVSEKKMLDSELQGRYQELLGLANGTDGNGVYLFSGFQNSKPFTETSYGNVTYNGDEGQRLIQISSGRQIPVSENGVDVFQRIKNGNGTFITAVAGNNGAVPTATNKGSGIISPGEVVDPSKWNAVTNKDVRVQFYWQANTADSTKPVITYDLIDNTTGNSLIDGTATAGHTSGPRAYVDGGDIEFKQLAGEVAVPAWDYGIKTSVSGTPVEIDPLTKAPAATTGNPPVANTAGAADSFSIKASTNVDLFTTLGNFTAALTSYTTDGAGKGQAAFQNQLNGVMQSLNNALNSVLTTQASIGARMKETESVQNTTEDLKLQYQKTLSTLEDLDYNAAISDFAMNQMLLDATRSSFSKVQDLSLFKYI